MEENSAYNRIVIIGNGFDMAMGLKTSYSDFLLDYLKHRLNAATDTVVDNSLVQINRNGISYRNSRFYAEKASDTSTLEELLNFMKNNSNYCKVTYRGILADILSFHEIQNWVDIESLYFDSMVPMIDRLKNSPPKNKSYSNIEILNKSFRELTNNLDDYIHKVNDNPLGQNIADHFYDFLELCVKKQTNKQTCLNHKADYNQLENPENVLFLNFNYTNSLNKILGYNGLNPKYQIVNIHGQAGKKSNPIIFGYGDDTHPKYNELEQENSDIPLEFIKSFYYNRTPDYHKMLGFMESNKYEVYIVGHSCGLSDRTLLKSIFEQDNCGSIKIFHRGSIEEHIKKNMAISRHFDDKQLLRKRVLPFDVHAIIPQANIA